MKNALKPEQPRKMKTIKNRRAEHDYFIIQTLEAGIALKGTEIKSIRAGKVNFKDSYAKIEDGECGAGMVYRHAGFGCGVSELYPTGSVSCYRAIAIHRLIMQEKS